VDPAVGVVLSGGAANGAYEVGVLKALLHGASPATGYRPIDPGTYTGTSVGAYNAAIMASRPGKPAAAVADELEALWLDRVANSLLQCGNGVFRVRGAPFQFFDPGCLARPVRSLLDFGVDLLDLSAFGLRKGAEFAASDAPLQSRLLELFDVEAFVSESPLKQLVEETVDRDGLLRSEQRLTIAASNWKYGVVQLYSKLQIAQVGNNTILASAALPGIFPPVIIEGVPYVDGGVLLNTPLKPAIADGATTIHIVFVDPLVKNIVLPKEPASIDTYYRLFAIIWAANVHQDVLTAAAINAGLGLAARAQPEAAATAEARGFLRVAQRLYQRSAAGGSYHQLDVHMYQPVADLGGGAGLLDFRRERLSKLIDMGYYDAVNHDCAAAGCALAGPSPAATTAAPRLAEAK